MTEESSELYVVNDWPSLKLAGSVCMIPRSDDIELSPLNTGIS